MKRDKLNLIKMEKVHNTTVEEVIFQSDSFKKNLKAITVARNRAMLEKNERRRSDRMVALPNPYSGLARIPDHRLADLYIEIRERRCTSLPASDRKTLAILGDEAVNATMRDIASKAAEITTQASPQP